MQYLAALLAVLALLVPVSLEAQATPFEPSKETEAARVPEAETGTEVNNTQPNPGGVPDATSSVTPPPSEEGTDGGPRIVIPEEQTGAQERAGVDPLRGMQESRFQGERKTTVGGYGELHLNVGWAKAKNSGIPNQAEVDLHRLVLFIAHRFNDQFRFYTEIEVEHALASSGAPGEVAIEQAFVDWRLLDSEAIALRFGVILVPLGIINQWHEPPIFHGVERPRVDTVIIPTTWREAGIGLFGQPIDGLRYEFYLMGGLDAAGFTAEKGLRSGRQKVAEANVKGPAMSARLEYEPILGMVAGLGGYVGWAGPNTALVDAPVIVGGITGDWRIIKRGIEARALVSYFHVGDTDVLRQPLPGETEPFSDIGSHLLGSYGEIAYDLLFTVGTEHQLLPFVRAEYYDTTFQEKDPAFDKPGVFEPRIGLSYRPIPQFVIKTDFLVAKLGKNTPLNFWNFGVGWMF